MTVDQDENNEDTGDDWEGSIQKMKSFNQRMFDGIEQKVEFQLNKISELIEKTSKKDQIQDREDKEKQNKIVFSNYMHMTRRFDDIVERIGTLNDNSADHNNQQTVSSLNLQSPRPRSDPTIKSL